MTHLVNLDRRGWVLCGSVEVYPSPIPEEDHNRIDVELEDGSIIRGCHPDCVRPVSSQEKEAQS